MDGKDAIRRLREVLDEESTGTWMDTRTSYDFLWEAATEYAERTGCLTAEQRIITQANVPNYALNWDFLRLHLRDSDNRFYIKFNNGSSDTFIKHKDYGEIYYNNSNYIVDLNASTTGLTTATGSFTDDLQDFSDWETTAGNAGYEIVIYDDDGRESKAFLGELTGTALTAVNIHSVAAVTGAAGFYQGSSTGTPSNYEVRKVSGQEVPGYFFIRDKQSLNTQITGTATSAGAATGGKSTLTDASGLFLTTDYVSPGDTVHNTTDASDGVVLAVTAATTIDTALFGGTGNDWSYSTGSADAYIIQPQGRSEIYLDPPPSTSNHLIRVPYISRPAPVYSDYGTYRFSQQAMEAIIRYAAWMYKYRDSEPDFGDRLFIMWDRAVRNEAHRLNPYLNRRRIKVNLKAR